MSIANLEMPKFSVRIESQDSIDFPTCAVSSLLPILDHFALKLLFYLSFCHWLIAAKTACYFEQLKSSIIQKKMLNNDGTPEINIENNEERKKKLTLQSGVAL